MWVLNLVWFGPELLVLSPSVRETVFKAAVVNTGPQSSSRSPQAAVLQPQSCSRSWKPQSSSPPLASTVEDLAGRIIGADHAGCSGWNPVSIKLEAFRAELAARRLAALWAWQHGHLQHCGRSCQHGHLQHFGPSWQHFGPGTESGQHCDLKLTACGSCTLLAS